jgi:hypothetical protein
MGKATLAMPSKNLKVQTRLLVRAPHINKPKTVKKNNHGENGKN